MLIFLSAVMAFLFMYATWSDHTKWMVSNEVVAMMMALWLVRLVVAPESVNISSDMMTFGFVSMFLIGQFLILEFFDNEDAFGGGDMKIIMASALWFGGEWFISYLVAFGILGAVLAGFYLVMNAGLSRFLVAVLPASNSVVEGSMEKGKFKYMYALGPAALWIQYQQLTGWGVI